jgi:hypothetical protein
METQPYTLKPSGIHSLHQITEQDLNPVVTLELTLKGLPSSFHGNLGKTICHHIVMATGWLRTHFKHQFDVYNGSSRGLATLIKEIDVRVKELETLSAHREDQDGLEVRFLVILTTPSNPETGHIQASSQGLEVTPSEASSLTCTVQRTTNDGCSSFFRRSFPPS